MPEVGLQTADPAATVPNPARKKARVLLLLYSVCHGGIESALIHWYNHFDRERFDVHFAYFAGDRGREKPFLRAAELNGIPVIPVPWGKNKPFFRCAHEVARIVNELEIDIVHTHAYYADAVGALVKAFVPVKVVSTVYVWGKYELHRQLMQVMDWFAIQFMDAVTAHCYETQRKTFWRFTPPSRIPVLIAGFPTEHTAPSAEERRRLRQSQGIGDDDVLMVNVARIAPEKAHDQLLRSFRIVLDHHPNAKLWISGVGLEDVQKNLDALQTELKLGSHVQFVGYRENLWPMLDAADFMVHPSHVEGVPIAILYGMAAGLPLVVSRVGGLPEVINDHQTGVFVAENDVEGFARSILELIANRDRAREIGRAARRFIETEYSVERAVEKVQDVYDEVLGFEDRNSCNVRGQGRRRA
jgi:glycosyltransferase involved in cell wall biosynthesis